MNPAPAPIHLRLPDSANDHHSIARHADVVGGFTTSEHRLTILTQFLPATTTESFIGAAKTAALDARKAGLAITGFDYDLVNTNDIARRANRHPHTIRQYIHHIRGPGHFPHRFGRAGRSDIWDWGTVNAWLRAFDGSGDPGYLPPHVILEELNTWLATKDEVFG